MTQYSSASYPVMEHFYTIQGEGKYTGTSAYFIRLGGCDVGCVWCDVKESWDADIHPKMTVDELITVVAQYPGELVVITGGEPAMYDLSVLVDALHSIGKYVAIETSGTSPLVGAVDWYTFSPKKFKSPVDEAYNKASELKIVIFHQSDLKWAEEHSLKVNDACVLYLQPEWSKREQLLPTIIEYVKNHPKWKISLQTHKYLEIP
ncbi:7-carboxy-7-deazaguanine synthase QueE [Fluviicola taffensis]|uniref:7-carboxy-7-deazaguanine synthase n=1 Tax=Fluviicola taffensis (strain DSM 16823 / NCIMB 13979 / RW262) TaxID=755732 RepID=F2IH51_FLUTR|nr:7-carboxy-7-deazaguanine synthase QueE [Fluviicola taffensis]AEA45865.1 Radical SAM domain protein [Fluviicola taffensis DSM 16823]